MSEVSSHQTQAGRGCNSGVPLRMPQAGPYLQAGNCAVNGMREPGNGVCLVKGKARKLAFPMLVYARLHVSAMTATVQDVFVRCLQPAPLRPYGCQGCHRLHGTEIVTSETKRGDLCNRLSDVLSRRANSFPRRDPSDDDMWQSDLCQQAAHGTVIRSAPYACANSICWR